MEGTTRQKGRTIPFAFARGLPLGVAGLVLAVYVALWLGGDPAKAVELDARSTTDGDFPEIVFSDVPDGWNQPGEPASNTWAGEVASHEYVFWPESEVLTTRPVVEVCVTRSTHFPCNGIGEVVARIDLGSDIRAVVSLLPSSTNTASQTDRSRWSRLSVRLAQKESVSS